MNRNTNFQLLLPVSLCLLVLSVVVGAQKYAEEACQICLVAPQGKRSSLPYACPSAPGAKKCELNLNGWCCMAEPDSPNCKYCSYEEDEEEGEPKDSADDGSGGKDEL